MARAFQGVGDVGDGRIYRADHRHIVEAGRVLHLRILVLPKRCRLEGHVDVLQKYRGGVGRSENAATVKTQAG